MSEISHPPVKIHPISRTRGILLAIFGHLVKAWQKSLRLEGMATFEELITHAPRGSMVLLWHNRLFSMIAAYQKAYTGTREIHALISASRDGSQISQFVSSLGIVPIRGSSSRRGAVAIREIVKALGAGHHVAITVDGPRGPCYQTQPGAALLVQLTRAPVVLIGAEFEAGYALRSWDGFIIPAPFSRVKIKLDRLALPDLPQGKDQRKTIQELIQERLSRLTTDIHLSP